MSLLTAESVMKVAYARESLDNITVVVVGFDNLLRKLGI